VRKIIRTGNGVIKCLLGKVACLIWGVQDLVVENGEVEGKTKTDWVGGSKISLSNLGSVLVCLERLVGRLLSLVANGKLSQVAVVIALPAHLLGSQNVYGEHPNKHLMVEDLRLSALSTGDQVLVENLKDIFTDFGKLGLNLLTVLLDQCHLS
jgi:hypothetical protein